MISEDGVAGWDIAEAERRIVKRSDLRAGIVLVLGRKFLVTWTTSNKMTFIQELRGKVVDGRVEELYAAAGLVVS